MEFRVVSIIDGDTFKVSPNWAWTKSDGENVSGDTVRIAGLSAPEVGQPGYQEASDALLRAISGQPVSLVNPVNISYGRLVCDVYVNGSNIFKS